MYVKRWLWMMVLAVLLCGCKAEETLETVSDEWIVPVMAQPKGISVRLPENTVLPVMEQDGRKLYMGQNYEILLETLAAGDLNDTIRTISGFEKEQLTVLQTGQGELDRYEFVWTATGERGELLGRAVILDDGNYHYVLTAMADAQDAGKLSQTWQTVFQSFGLEPNNDA